MVRGLSSFSYQTRMLRLGLPSLEYRRERSDVIQVYTIFTDIDTVDKGRLFEVGHYEGTRGIACKIIKKRARTELRRSIFSQRVVNPWNSLPNEVVTAPTLNSFKSRLNKFWVGGSKFNPKCYQ